MFPFRAYLRGAQAERDIIRVWFVQEETPTRNYVVEALVNTVRT
jgi:hypothetical protein